MKNLHPLSAFLLVASSATLAFCQTAASTETAQTSPAPVAYVYVSKANSIDAFSAAANGKLNSVPGSPFEGSLKGMATNGKYLFGAGSDQKSLYSYSVATNGALKLADKLDPYVFGACAGLQPPVLDHTGQFLYAGISTDEDDTPEEYCSFQLYQSYGVDDKTGQLKFLGQSQDFRLYFGKLSFAGNNQLAYGAYCTYDATEGHFYVSSLLSFQRQSDNSLTLTNYDNAPPTKSPDDFYCTQISSSDAANHLAVVLQPNTSQAFNGPPQLASYSEDADGSLTTDSTYENMPVIGVAQVNDLQVSPSGRLAAVAGKGFQIFHFNGAQPATPYSGVLHPGYLIEQLAWDSADHLYALSKGKLFVFTVTPDSIEEAVGSPYSLDNASSLTVRSQPK